MRSALAMLAASALLLAACGDDPDSDGGNSGGVGQEPQTEEPSKPVKVTNADMEFIGDAIIEDFRKEADLFGDLGADYDAECEQAGVGKVSCEIVVFDNGKEVNRYTKTGTFDPADPRSFKVASVSRR